MLRENHTQKNQCVSTTQQGTLKEYHKGRTTVIVFGVGYDHVLYFETCQIQGKGSVGTFVTVGCAWMRVPITDQQHYRRVMTRK